MSRRRAQALAPAVDATSPAPSEPRAAGELVEGPGWALHRGLWQAVLAEVTADLLLFDAPYSAGTHSAATTRSDGFDPADLTPSYAALSEADVRAFCESWAPRCRGWMISITDSDLFPVWRDEMERVGRYAFRAPVPIFIPGMSVRIQGDGPSSWTLYAAVSRPRTKEFATWGTLPGYYGPISTGAAGERGGGRGKQRAITDAFVRDYSRAGDVVVDPFAGWGGTLASAVAYGRTAIGSEMDADAHREAVRRLRRPLQVDMFASGSEAGVTP